jgi:hypothetical protein
LDDPLGAEVCVGAGGDLDVVSLGELVDSGNELDIPDVRVEA